MKIKLQIFLASILYTFLGAQGPSPEGLTLDRSIQLALQHNLSLLQAESDVEFSTGSIKRVLSGSLPKLDLYANYSQLDTGLLETFGGSSFGSDKNWSAGVQLTQSLYQGSNNVYRLNEEKARLTASEAALAATLQDVILSVKENWFQALLAHEIIQVREESFRLLEEEFQSSQDRYETGAISRFELLRAEVSLSNSRTPLIRAKNDYELAIVDLYQSMGLERPDTESVYISASLPTDPYSISLDEALRAAKKNRHELVQAEKNVEAAFESVKSVKTGWYPSLTLTAGYGVQKSAFSPDLDDTVDGWSLGVEGNWRIWDSFRTKGALIEANSIARKAELSLAEIELNISAEVRRAHASLEEAIALLDASRKVVEQAEEALKIAKDRYSVGNAIQLDLLNAEVSLTEARTNEVNALYQFNVAKAQLERSMGVLVAPSH